MQILRLQLIAIQLTLLITVVPASGQSDSASTELPTTDGKSDVLDQQPGRGEQCLGCNRPIHAMDVMGIRNKGRMFHVMTGSMFDQFTKQPDRFFKKLQARSAHFGGGPEIVVLFFEIGIVPIREHTTRLLAHVAVLTRDAFLGRRRALVLAKRLFQRKPFAKVTSWQVPQWPDVAS